MTSEEKTMKMEKLEWYKEVLTLEPTSKMFLSLARLLAEIGQAENDAEYMNEAFEVLRKGLTIHPDFIEARLFLVELLNACGCRSQCGAEVARLASLFLSYPDFWDAWREYAITENESSDFTVALGFMSAIMRNKSLSIVQVLEAGLNALKVDKAINFNSGELNFAQPIHEEKTFVETPVEFIEKDEEVIEEKQEEKQDDEMLFEETEKEDVSFQEENELIAQDENENEENLQEDEVSLADVLPKSHVENYANFVEQQQTKQVNTKQALAELIKDANITVEPIEKSPFRTKGMADLLAEQGDYKGAVDIYRELIAKGEGNVSELEERVADLIALCPKLDEKIDTSNLFAIDDLVDTSFGLMAKETVSTFESARLGDLPVNNSYLEKNENNSTDELNEVEFVQDEMETSFDSDISLEESSDDVELAQEQLELTEEVNENIEFENMDSSLENEEVKEENIMEENALFVEDTNEDIVLQTEEQPMEVDEMSFAEKEIAEDFVQESDNIEEVTSKSEVADFDDTAMLVSDGLIIETEDKDYLDETELNSESSEDKTNTDVADLLAKLAERLEIRAN